MKRPIVRCCVAALALASACGGASDGGTGPGPTPIAVSISPTTAALSVGQTQQLNAQVSGAADVSVRWSSNAGAVASVSSGGLVTAVSPGTATITAKAVADTTRLATAVVTVSGPSVETLTPGTPLTVSGATSSWRYLRVVVPSNATQLTLRLAGGSGDADLYGAAGRMPDTLSAACVSTNDGNDEACVVSSPTPGDWFFLLNGYSAYSGATATATVLTTPTPGYVLTATPSPLVIPAGGTQAIDVRIQRVGGFNDPVTLAASFSVTGFRASSQNIAAGQTSGSITITAPATGVTGKGMLIVRGSATGLEPRATAIGYDVTSVATPAFALSLNSTSVNLQPGGNATIGVTVARSGGFAGDVALAASGLPSGVTASVSPATIGASQTTSTVTLTASTSAAIGTSTITIQGTSAGQTPRTATATVNVQSAGASGGVTIQPTVSTITIARGQYVWIYPSVKAGSFSGSGTLSVSGLPSGVTAGFSFGDASLGSLGTTGGFRTDDPAQTNRLKLTASATASLGASSMTITATSSAGAVVGTTLVQVRVVDARDASLPAVTQIAGGFGSRECLIRSDGSAYCWGNNVPDGALTNDFAPSPVAGNLSFAQIAMGHAAACGIVTGGDAYCWGSANDFGQLGTGAAATAVGRVPTAVSGGLKYRSIGASNSSVCAVTTTGALYCWGSQLSGLLADGVIATSNGQIKSTPGPATSNVSFSALFGGNSSMCGITSAGAAYCWGENASGQLGDGTTATRAVPTAVGGAIAFRKIALASATTCGLATDGALYCWGLFNSFPGAPASTNTTAPRRVGTGTFTDLAASNQHFCALTTTGQAQCFGQNSGGQLGNGTTSNSSTAFVNVSGGLTFTSIAAGGTSAHTCGVTTTRAVYCWGNNSAGELGIGTRTSSNVPVLVSTF